MLVKVGQKEGAMDGRQELRNRRKVKSLRMGYGKVYMVLKDTHKVLFKMYKIFLE